MRGGLVRSLALAAAVLAAAASGAEERGPITQHTLWTGEGGHAPVSLLGSIHLLRRQNHPPGRVIEDAFDAAQVVAFEIDLDTARAAIAAPEPTPVLPKSRTSPPHRPPRKLTAQISRETYQGVVRYLEGN